MESSPPVRSYERAPSRAESKYSLDLDALNLDAESDVSDTIPEPKIDRILSTDIDGPSDFTQNMEAYLLRGTISKASAPVKNGPLPVPERNPESRPQTPSRDQSRQQLEDDVELDQPRPSSTTTPSRSVHSLPDEAEDDEDDFSSEWDPHGATSTPAMWANKRLLQPSVEEYHSELNLARSVPRQISNREPLATTKPDNPPRLAETELQTQLAELQARCAELEQSNRVLSQEMNEEKRLREAREVAYRTQLEEAADRERGLVELRSQAEQDYRDICKENAQLEERVRSQEQITAEPESDDLRKDHAARITHLNSQINKQLSEHNQIVASLQQDIKTLRQSRADAIESARLSAEELHDQEQMHQAEIKRLRVELDHNQDQDFALAELERNLQQARTESELLKTARAETEEDLATARTQLSDLRDTHRETTTRLTAERSRAVDLATTLQRQLTDLRTQLRDTQTTHAAELQRLETEHRATQTLHTREMAVLRDAHDAQETALNDAILAQAGAEEAFRAAMEEEVRALVAEREARWREKLEAALEERRVMSRVLLQQWGREEVGPGSPQGFRYRFGPDGMRL